MLNVGQVEQFQRRKRRSIVVLVTSIVLLAAGCALRFIPRLNDRLSGRPQYLRALTLLTTREVARVSQYGSPVVLLGEDERCDPLQPTGITEDQMEGMLYLFTYSERNRFSCMTAAAIPVDSSKFSGLRTIRPEDGWTEGPRLLRPANVLPVLRTMRVYPAEYLRLLHWRARPWLPISEKQVQALASRRYESASDASISLDTRADITLDFEQVRALVRERHDQLNFQLSLMLVFLGAMPFCVAGMLLLQYKNAFRHLQQYEQRLTFGVFVFHDLNDMTSAAQSKHIARQMEIKTQQRTKDALHSFHQELELGLRSALERLHDADLRKRVQDCLSVPLPDLEKMKQLGEEVKECLGHKMPEERLALLLESLKDLCSPEEFGTYQEQASMMLHKSGFRTAREFAVQTHTELKLRAKQAEEEAETAVSGPDTPATPSATVLIGEYKSLKPKQPG